MITTRVVVQHTPKLFAILGLVDVAELQPVLFLNGQSYYRASTHDHFVLYKAAVSGGGAAPTLDPRQR